MVEERKVEWKFLDCDRNQSERLAQKLGVSKIIGMILVQRGLRTATEAERFIAPKISDLKDPFLVKNMKEAVTLFDAHVRRNSPMALIGDYDVDGITSTVLFIDILKKFNNYPKYFIPRRFSEGYGMSMEIVHRMLKKIHPSLVIALDCGTNSVNEINFLRKKGIDVLIIDHHTLTLPQMPNAVIINPHLEESYPSLKAMCTVGLGFKFMHAFLKHRREQGDERAMTMHLRNYFDLVALGTIADMMPVLHENRVMVKYGLRSFAKTRRPGLDALCTISNILPGQMLSQQDVSFKLAPRINVSGRLSDASLPVELLLADNIGEAIIKAKKIDQMNRERQRIEYKVTVEAEAIVREHYQNDPGIVLFHPHWHSGVVGIVAGKLAREYNCPVVVLALERGLAKGSGRSTGENLVRILTQCTSHMECWGGHKLAIGITLKPENIDAFRTAFNQSILNLRKEIQAIAEQIEIVCTLNKEDIEEQLVEELEDNIQPYGHKNEEPIFCIKNIRFANGIEFFGAERQHFRFWIERKDRSWLPGIGWNMASRVPWKGHFIDILVKISLDTWNNERFILLQLVDWRYAQ
ncbi:MAG: single-stranded-DNA-specific exonuclease RecJ [Puniceicoccales bacterium]|nr:single-stranded-DNA-specific exonuclease RecJ [Puniceicoccales bacterium]